MAERQQIDNVLLLVDVVDDAVVADAQAIFGSAL